MPASHAIIEKGGCVAQHKTRPAPCANNNNTTPIQYDKPNRPAVAALRYLPTLRRGEMFGAAGEESGSPKFQTRPSSAAPKLGIESSCTSAIAGSNLDGRIRSNLEIPERLFSDFLKNRRGNYGTPVRPLRFFYNNRDH